MRAICTASGLAVEFFPSRLVAMPSVAAMAFERRVPPPSTLFPMLLDVSKITRTLMSFDSVVEVAAPVTLRLSVYVPSPLFVRVFSCAGASGDVSANATEEYPQQIPKTQAISTKIDSNSPKALKLRFISLPPTRGTSNPPVDVPRSSENLGACLNVRRCMFSGYIVLNDTRCSTINGGRSLWLYALFC